MLDLYISTAEVSYFILTTVQPDLHATSLLTSHVLFALIFSSPGVSADPALYPDLYPCWSNEADHPAGSEPAPASVGTEKLRVHLSHPGQHSQCSCSEVQQHKHTVSEDNGKNKNTHVLQTAVLL